MTVWKLVPDFRFTSFYTSEPDAKEIVEVEYTSQILTCGPMLPIWRPLKIVEENKKLQRGNFSRSWGGGFVVDANARRVVGQMPSDDFELLPLLPVKDEVFHVLNVLVCVGCLDTERTRYAIDRTSGTKLARIQEHHFVSELIPSSMLFRIPRRVSLLTASGRGTSKLDFKSLVEREKLTGLKFEKLWSDDEPR